MKLLSALVSLLLLLVILTFALSNRQATTVSLWPFDVAITAPLALWMLGSLVIGLLFGGLFVWLGSLPYRLRMRRLGKDVVALADRLLQTERELEQYRDKYTPKLSAPTRPKWKFWNRSQ